MDFSLLIKECQFRASRSSGSGGQHVNKVSTRVELIFNIIESKVLSPAQKILLQERLQHRITKDGAIIIDSQGSRSQLKNKHTAISKFEALIITSLKKPKKRKAVKPLTANKTKRLERKKRQSEKKAQRRKIEF